MSWRRSLLLLAVLSCAASAVQAQPGPKQRPAPKNNVPPIRAVTPIVAPAMVIVALDDRMPYTQLSKAKIIPNLCMYKYRVTTSSTACQQFVDQSLGYYYSYVWMEAARSAETATIHDPDCAYAWFILSRALEKWGRGDATKALKKAEELLAKAGHREKLIITAKLQEKGMVSGVTPEQRKKKAAQTLDELLTIYGDDEEGWFARAQINGGTEGVPYYRALLQINPIHPGASHELVHFFEGYKRPALGWPYAEAYMASSPGLPHAFHMQAHLAMRIGKWTHTTDWSVRAIEMQKAYHKEMNVTPSQDWQFSHHLEIMTTSLVHDGRFTEVRAARAEAEKYNYKSPQFMQLWFRCYLGERDWAEATKIVEHFRKTDKSTASYLAALLYLEQGETTRAAAEVEVVRQEQQRRKSEKRLELRYWEVQGRLLCQQGIGESGLKLLQRAVDKTKDDYSSHQWGHGADFMEAWGIGALEAGNAEVAEEAFLEALAHDAGSVRAALGLHAMCARLGRNEEAERYLALGRRCWAKAESKHFEFLRESMVKRASKIPTGMGNAAGGN